MKRLVASAALAGLTIAGCGRSDGPDTSSEEGVTTIEAKDFAFVPDEVSVETGEITFSVTNTGKEIHEFEVFQGERLLDEVENITPGLTRQLTMTLGAGTYEYACRFEDHYERGMKGTLKVT